MRNDIKQSKEQPNGGGSSDLLTVREAASMLRLQVSTIRAWVLHRRIRYVKLGGKRVFFRRVDLEALVTASLVPAKSAECEASGDRAA
jgi:excisionase family DNA binding protein